MCWSGQADLVLGLAVTGIGLTGLTCARNRHDVPLAALPVLLGAHQLIESHIWNQSAGTGSEMRGPSVTAWTLIAFVVLPLFVPAALLYSERQRRRVQFVAGAFGIPVAAVMTSAVLNGNYAQDAGNVMHYRAGIPLLPLVVAGYLVATCVPLLTSPEATMRHLGATLSVGAVLVAAADLLAFASTWCAFAAAVSVLIVRRTIHASRHLPRPAPAVRPGAAPA